MMRTVRQHATCRTTIVWSVVRAKARRIATWNVNDSQSGEA
jgi:hypothetical protein